MDPTLIVFGIRTILRLAQEGTAAFSQYQRDRPALFPDAIEADFRKIDFIRDTFIPDHIDQLIGDGALAKFWGDLVPAPNVANATEVLYMAAVQLRAERAARRSQLSPGRGIEVGGALMIQQWAEGKGPVGPLAQIFLGRGFNTATAVGALTQALLQEASLIGLRELFSEADFIAINQAALGVAIDRPELFIGDSGRASKQLTSDLFAKIASALRGTPPPFNSDFGANLAIIALEGLREHGLRSVAGSRPWEDVLVSAVMQVVDGLKAALEHPDSHAIESLLSRQQLLEFARIFLIQAAKTPGMLTGDQPELQAIVRGVAQAMAQDQNLLLTPQDWLSIATVAAEVAAANPHRLFKLASASLGTGLIEDLLSVAAAEFAAGGRALGGVLFGATLREAMVVALQAAAGNAQAAMAHRPVLKSLASQLSELVREKPDRYGCKEWLLLYRVFIGRVLQSGTLSPLTELQITPILAGGTVA